jgi:hypothetical protein
MGIALLLLKHFVTLQVAVNNCHFCSYADRTLRIKIRTVQIQGDVTLNLVEYRMAESYPEIWPDMRDPVVTISHTMPLSDSIRDNVVSAYHIVHVQRITISCFTLVIGARHFYSGFTKVL